MSYTATKGISFITFRFGVTNSGDTICYKNIQVEHGDTPTPYEPYIGSTANLTSALPLCGIPVDADGNYTDVNGQQWICDELIYNADGTGKIVKRTKLFTADGDSNVFFQQLLDNGLEIWHTPVDNTLKETKCYCSHLKEKPASEMKNGNEGVFVYDDSSAIYIRCETKIGVSNVDELKAWLQSNPMTFIAAIAEPQEIPLTAAEMARLKALQTFDGVTNISNDGGAEMSVKYCTNRALSEYEKPVIDGLKKQIDELKIAVLSLGGNV